jgi:phosphoglucomutase
VANATQSVKQTLKTLEMTIRFGTSSWRAVIADEFTFAGVRRVTDAICTHFGAPSEGGLMTIGHDTRFLGEGFAAECAEIVAGNGFRALICADPTRTPVISNAIRSQNAVSGINFTPSEN